MHEVNGLYYVIGIAPFVNQTSCRDQESEAAKFTRVKKFLDFICSTSGICTDGEESPAAASGAFSIFRNPCQSIFFLYISLLL